MPVYLMLSLLVYLQRHLLLHRRVFDARIPHRRELQRPFSDLP